MRRHGDRGVVKWLELAVSQRWQEQEAVVAVHPIAVAERQPCFGVTLDQRWLCGSDGALTFFDSVEAATRFLHLLKIDRLAMGGRRDCDATESAAFQCLQLGAKGLTTCNKCGAGKTARTPMSRAQVRAEERR